MPSNRKDEHVGPEEGGSEIADLSDRSLTSEQAAQVRGGILAASGDATLNVKYTLGFNPKELSVAK